MADSQVTPHAGDRQDCAHPPSTPTRDDAPNLLPCPFCGERLNLDADGDAVHPGGTCFLARYNVFSLEFEDWNCRAATSDTIEALIGASIEAIEAKDAEIARLTAQRDQWQNDCLDANISEGGLRARAERAEAALGSERDNADRMADLLSDINIEMGADAGLIQEALDAHDKLREQAIAAHNKRREGR